VIEQQIKPTTPELAAGSHDGTPEEGERLITCPLCEKLGTSARFRRISPQHLAKHGKTMKDFRREYPNAPLTSIATREADKRQWANPKTRGRRIKAIKAAAVSPGVRERHSAGMRRALQDPVKKQRILDGVKRANEDPQLVQRRLNALRTALAKPQVRRRFSAARKRDWQNPGVRVKLVKHLSQIWADRKQELAEAERKLMELQEEVKKQEASVAKLKARKVGRTPTRSADQAKFGPRIKELRREKKSWGQVRMIMNNETGRSWTASGWRHLVESSKLPSTRTST
jgi:hypothetical protein